MRDLTVCASLGEVELQRFGELMHEVVLQPGAPLAAEGEAAYHVFNVTSGMLKLMKLQPDGRRQIIGFLSVGDVLGLAPGKTYACGAEAVGEVRLCRFPRDRLLAMLEELPSLQHCLFVRAAGELGAAEEQMLLLGRKAALERLASFVLIEAERGARRGEAADSVELPMSRTDIADYLGLTGESVSRAFTRLAREGCIGPPQGQRLRIQRRAALAAMAGAETATGRLSPL